MTADAREVQVALLQRMTAERKLALAAQMRQAAWDLKAGAIRRARPELLDHEVQDRVRQVFRDAGS
ncbi:MAG TPA: hypothetical protein VK845_02275 [Gemmatimonadales bacterium]|nr:hypothetical protein [Gemmatimonadales bacterium]